MKKFVIAAIVLGIVTLIFRRCNCDDLTDIQEGDVVFIESQSSQSPYIKVGTMSKWTHCGVVVDTPNGLKVLEASKTVRLTSFESFIGVAKNDNWCLKRPEHKLSKPISPTAKTLSSLMASSNLNQSSSLNFLTSKGK